MKVIILSGGFATRLWPLTESIAKPLIHIAGKPLISYIIESLPEEFEIIISTNKIFANDFINWKKKYFAKNKIIIFEEDSFGESTKKGALAATAMCIDHYKIDNDIILLAGDNYFGFKFSDFLKNTTNNPMLAVYDIESKKKAKKFGVIVPKNNKEILFFEEKPNNPSSSLVSTGAYFLPKKLLNDLIICSKKNEDDLGGVFEYFLKNNQTVEYFSFSEPWYDIGSFEAFMQMNKDFISNKSIKDKSVKFDEKTTFSGFSLIEKNVTLKNVKIENSIIMEGSYIENCDIKDSVISPYCILKNKDFFSKIIRAETLSIEN
jgi:glucose-1-phosphate thymidylyltransferase